MAIDDVQLVHHLGGKQDETGRWTYDVLYRVITTDRYDGAGLVCRATGIPQRGDTYVFGNEGDTWAFCVGQDARLQAVEESRYVWHVTVSYKYPEGREDEKRDPTDPPANPLNEPPVIETYTSKGRKAILKDQDGRLIASSAGEPYDPVQEIDDTKYMLRITRNMSSINLILNAMFRDAINGDVFFGCSRRTVKVETPGAVKKLYMANGTPYYQETWEFAIDNNGWDVKLYDYGRYQLVEGERQIIRDATGADIGSPVLLNGSGSVLAAGASPVEITPAFKVYKEMMFQALNLPQSM